MTKHTPATPLPWIVGDARREARAKRLINSARSPVLTASTAQDAAYIAHAANAYPRLVEALRDLTGLVSRYPDVFGADETNMNAYLGDANSLLRELGEL